MSVAQETRVCEKCGEEKPLTREYFKPSGSAGKTLRYKCRACEQVEDRERWHARKYRAETPREKSLVPTRTEIVTLEGRDFTVGWHKDARYWPVKPFVEAAEMDWSAQYRRIVADSRMEASVVNLAIETSAGPRSTLCLPWSSWHYFWSGTHSPKAERWRNEAYEVLRLVFGETASEVLQDKPVDERIRDTAQRMGIDPIGFIETNADEVRRLIEVRNEAHAAAAAANSERERASAEVQELEDRIAQARARAEEAERRALRAQLDYEAARDALRLRAAGPAPHLLYVWLCAETRNDVQIKIGRTTNLSATERAYKRPAPHGRMVFSAVMADQESPDAVENAAQALVPQHLRLRGERNGITESFVLPVSLYRELMEFIKARPHPLTRESLRGFSGGRMF